MPWVTFFRTTIQLIFIYFFLFLCRRCTLLSCSLCVYVENSFTILSFSYHISFALITTLQLLDEFAELRDSALIEPKLTREHAKHNQTK